MTTKIDNTNYELWLLRYAEGDLGADERAAVEAWLAGHPEAAAELSLYREAPRLERDQSVRYVATPLQPTAPQPAAPRPLWPLLARWSAAAAVIAALMLPALRMGGLATLPPQEEAPQLLAEATPPTLPSAKQAKPIKATEPTKTIDTVITTGTIKTIDTIDAIETIETIKTIETAKPIPSTNLIALEEEVPEADVWPSLSLIDCDHSVDWGDLLLAANDTFRESIAKVKNRLQQ